ncbi:MAG: isoleucine--tRNA ligase [Deltaproteobacteria bacterium]|nr:isoleucine--tRNA ligase [Deltaproteobacteria bacterium]
MVFQSVPGRYDGVALEERMLRFWREHDIFHKTLEASQGRPRFVFNEGPPTANGRPGIHHVLARAFKDAFPRYKTMRGFYAPRRAGWDTHGLPVEHEVEKTLGIFDKKRIEREVGVEEFTRRCRESVTAYIADWEKMTERMGFWVDLKDAYATLDNRYIETVWHLLKIIWDKGLIYQDYKVVPYDPRIGATLSSHEVALGYKEVEDPSVHVRFRLADQPHASFLVWTTTPWTLPSNVALAVHPEQDYAWVKVEEETLILAAPRLEAVLGDTPYRVESRVKGKDLLGLRYQRLFEDLPVTQDICRVVGADFVSMEDGTGIVHIAPAYGADDLKVGRENNLPVLHGVGDDGCFLPQMKLTAGMFFKKADPVISADLKKRGLLFRQGTLLHNYPFGWRTGDPLIYYAKEAWYIRTTAVKARMVELNQSIQWIPETIKDGRFGNWLENNIDWALSRERFWGTPLPVWTDGEGNHLMVGSVAELEKLAGRSLTGLDLHRPAVDDITFPHPDTGKTMRRVPEVIDCWFDSGAMSYAQWHWPFEHQEEFQKHFPADFICEAIDQTRGWFYTLHAVATLVSDSAAYKNVVCLSHIVDKDGRKMSKSQGNIINPYDVFDKVGADPLRWYFLARLAPEAQKRVSVDIVGDVAGGFINTFWNTYAFFVMYANLDHFNPDQPVPLEQRPEIDRWALALLAQTVATATEAMDRYDAQGAGQAIETFVEQLSNWYVRRNRRRFWKGEAGDDKQAAYLTLYECLSTLTRLLAPFMPFLAEEAYQNLERSLRGEAPLSVHMTTWPQAQPQALAPELVAAMDVVQKVVSLGRAARATCGHRVRQPLPRLLVRVPQAGQAAVEAHQDQILEELNVKRLELAAGDAKLITYRLKPNLPKVGKKYGKHIPAIKAALESADAAAIAQAARGGQGFTLTVEGQALPFEAEDVLVETASAEGYVSAEDGGYLSALDTRLTPELLREGMARELVRTVQEARKNAGLEVSDRIALRITGSADMEDALAAHREFIMAETLAARWADAPLPQAFRMEHDLDGATWTIELTRATP